MSSRNNLAPLHNLVALIVAAIVIGAFALTGAAVYENIRFARATDQFLGVVDTVRQLAATQNSFAQTPNEDLWATLTRLGQIPRTSQPVNPWGGEVKVTALTNSALRLETELPTNECRRLSFYLLARKPSEMGLYSIDAQPPNSLNWVRIFPEQGTKSRGGDTIDFACGVAAKSRLALIFRFR